jgi:hypothetical protein
MDNQNTSKFYFYKQKNEGITIKILLSLLQKQSNYLKSTRFTIKKSEVLTW